MHNVEALVYEIFRLVDDYLMDDLLHVSGSVRALLSSM